MKLLRKLLCFGLSSILLVTTTSCGDSNSTSKLDTKESTTDYAYYHDYSIPDDNYRNYYEVFLYSYCDSNNDGIGDINGLISKLDYINDNNASTNTDLGYTGTLEDFDRLIEECHARDINVIIDFVFNHTSAQHPWFLAASTYLTELAPGETPDASICPYINYYNFVYGEPRNGGYHQLGDSNWYYEGQFWDQMPDLNLDNPSVRSELEQITDFWLSKGVDGFRLDAAKEYYTGQPSKNIETLSWFTSYVKEKNPKSYIVAEVWEGFPTYAEYYSSNVDSLFNFPFAQFEGKITSVIKNSGEKNSAASFGTAMVTIQDTIQSFYPNAIDAPFYVNHDMARASGYFNYNESQIKMAAGMNLMMSGCTFTYYGEELGMTGSEKDENKRAPMDWNRSGEGMTLGPSNMNPQENHFLSAEEQIEDSKSIYNYYRMAIRLRNENLEIARGQASTIDALSNQELCVIQKDYNNQRIYIVYNISDSSQTLNMSHSQYNYSELRGYLSTDSSPVTIQDESINLPPYSIAILK